MAQAMTQTDELDSVEKHVVLASDGVDYQVSSVDEDTITAESLTNNTEREYKKGQIYNALKEDFTVFDGGSLSEIKGIGYKTGPRVHAKTGCETPSELIQAFAENPGNVSSHIPRMGDFREWSLSNFGELQVSFSKAEYQVLLFDQDLDHNERSTTCIEGAGIERLDWSDGKVITDSANVAMIAHDPSGFEEVGFRETLEEMEPNKEYEDWEKDPSHTLFRFSGGETLISGEYLKALQEIMSFELSDVKCHPCGEFPVIIEDSETGNIAAIAPRVTA
jgi:hypothetical protein